MLDIPADVKLLPHTLYVFYCEKLFYWQGITTAFFVM